MLVGDFSFMFVGVLADFIVQLNSIPKQILAYKMRSKANSNLCLVD